MNFKLISKTLLAVSVGYGGIIAFLFILYLCFNAVYPSNKTNEPKPNNIVVTPPVEDNYVDYTGHLCGECGQKCVVGKEIPSKGDIISNFQPYYICGDIKCVESRYQKDIRANRSGRPTTFRKTMDSRYLQGSDGKLYEKELCGMCDGSGYESNRYGHVQKCHLCDGKGHKNY